MQFGESAARLSSMAAQLLGWRPWEFWNSTPAELGAAVMPNGDPDRTDMETLAELMRRFPDERHDHG